MSKKKAKLLAFLSIWPPVYISVFLLSLVALLMTGHLKGGQTSPLYFVIFAVVAFLHIFTIIDLLGLPVYYIYHIHKSDVVPENRKVPWTIALVVGNTIAMPLFWYYYVWNQLENRELEQNNSGSPD